MKKTIIFWIILFTILGGILRFYRLGDIPAGLHRDEAFLGYNAYSILKTARDMNGNFLPINLQSFLYSPGGYAYLSIPFIALFGLSAFAVRFASALFGTCTVILVYFLVRELFGQSSRNSKLALAASFLMAISPWNINLSRTATENIPVTFFILLSTLLYLLWIRRDKPIFVFLSFASFAITLTLYQAPRAFLPLFIPLLIFLYRPKPKQFITPLLLYVVAILVPVIIILMSPALSLRLRTVSLFASQNTQLSLDEYIREDGMQKAGTVASRLFHNKVTGYIPQFLENYASHFSYEFLFTDKGLPDRYRVPNIGLLYLVELPFLLIGLASLIKKPGKEGALIIGLILLAPIGSALTFDDIPNLQRTVFIEPALAIVSALGLISAVLYLKSNVTAHIYTVGLAILTALCLYNFVFYMHQYFVHLPVHKPWYRHEGYAQLVGEVHTLLPPYTKAVVTNRESAPAIFFLFYSQYDPAKFQIEAKHGQTTDLDRVNFGPYEFSQEECPLRLDPKTKELTGQNDILYVDYGTCKITEGMNVLKEVRRGDQSLVFSILNRQ